ncbi:unnamed protein product [Caretta caretta]
MLSCYSQVKGDQEQGGLSYQCNALPMSGLFSRQKEIQSPCLFHPSFFHSCPSVLTRWNPFPQNFILHVCSFLGFPKSCCPSMPPALTWEGPPALGEEVFSISMQPWICPHTTFSFLSLKSLA